MKRTFELHKRAINSKKNCNAICFLEECTKRFNFFWRSRAGVANLLHTKSQFFQTLVEMRHSVVCVL